MRNTEKLPRGVSHDGSHRGKKKYKARIYFQGKDRFLGRFTTAQAAALAYQQAMAYLKGNPSDLESLDPAVLTRIHTMMPRLKNRSLPASAPCSEQLVAPSPSPSSSHQTEADFSSRQHEELTSTQAPLLRQQSVPTSQSNTQHSTSEPLLHCSEQYDVAAEAAAATPAVTAGMPVADSSAMELDPVSSMLAAELQGESQMEPSGLYSNQLEEVLTAMLLNMPADQQQQPQQQQQQLVSVSSSCSLAALAAPQQNQHHHQQQAFGQMRYGAGGDLLSMLPAAAGSPVEQLPAAAQLLLLQQQQQQQQAQSQDALQQLLHEELQKALQEGQTQTGCSMQPEALQMPAVSVAPSSCPSNHSLGAAGSPVGPCAAANSAATPALAPVPAAAAAAGSSGIPPVLPANFSDSQVGGLAFSNSCVEAVMLTGACVHAVMDLHLTLLAKSTDEDAAADMMLWLAQFRQQQLQNPSRPMAVGLQASASPELDVDNQVLRVMGQAMRVLTGTASSIGANRSSSCASASTIVLPATASAAAVSFGQAPDSSGAVGVAGGSLSPGQQQQAATQALACRATVLAVLEKFEEKLHALRKCLMLHIHSQQPLVVWQVCEHWMQGLQTQAAASAEDALVLRLASLL